MGKAAPYCGVQPIDRTILLKTKNTSVISSNVNRKKYLVVTFKVTLMFNYPSPFIPSRKKTAKHIKTWIDPFMVSDAILVAVFAPKHGKIYSKCMGTIESLALDNSRKVDIL